METLKIKKVGEFQILNGFAQLKSDPEMTRIANREELLKLHEQIAVDEKIKQKNAFLKQKTQAKKNAGRAHGIIVNEESLIANAKNDEQKNLVRIEVQNAKTIKIKALKKVDKHSKCCDVCDIELSKLNTVCDLKRKKHIASNLIFSHPPANQVGVFPDGFDISILKEAYQSRKNQQIVIESKTIEKEVLKVIGKEPITAPFLEYVSHRTIEDFRGKQYYYKNNDGVWIREPIIEKLGVTKNTVVHDDFQDQAIEKSDMKPEDLEVFRTQNLTTEQKEVEKQAAIDSVLQQSINMRSGLEIQNDTDALSKSKTWYQEQLTEINGKYA